MNAQPEGGDPSSKLWDNSYVRGLAWFAGIVAAIVGTTIGGAEAIDSRYSKQSDVNELRSEMVAQAGKIDTYSKELQLQIDYNADRLRKQQLEDQVLRYDLTPAAKHTLTDTALVSRYRSEINQLNERWIRMGRPLK